MRAWRTLLASALLALSAHASAATLSEQVAAMAAPVQELMRRCAADPSPLSIGLIILLMGVVPFSVVLPGTVLAVLAGALLSAQIAPMVILAGLLLNTLLSWSLARTVFGRRLEGWIEKRGGAISALRLQARQGGVKWVIISRFMPAPFVLPPMLFASAGVPLSQVLGGTAIAMVPWAFVYAWAGRASREGSLQALSLAATAILLILGLSLWLRRRYVGQQAQGARNQSASRRVLKAKKKPSKKAKA